MSISTDEILLEDMKCEDHQIMLSFDDEDGTMIDTIIDDPDKSLFGYGPIEEIEEEEIFQIHYMRPALPLYQKQTRMPQENKNISQYD